VSTLIKVNVTRIGPQTRSLAWFALVLLTAALLLFPVHLIYEYRSIQAPYIFKNLPLFGALFYVWMLLLLLLLLSRKDEGAKLNWEKLGLSCLCGAVFIAFWSVITPQGSFSDDIYNMGHVRYLIETGSIPVGHINLHYFDLPGMHLIVSGISQISGLNIFQSRLLFLVFNAMLFAALMYIFFTKLLKNNRLAFVGVLLVIIGSISIIEKMRIFTPGAFGFTLLAAFLVMLYRSEDRLFGTMVADRLLMLVLFAAMTISYFPTPFLAPLVVAGIYLVQNRGGEKRRSVSLVTVALLLLLVLAWAIYMTFYTYAGFAKSVPTLWDDLTRGEFLRSAGTLGKANIGAVLPLWANTVRIIWWVVLILGTILGLVLFFRLKRLSLVQQILLGGLLGVIVLTIIATFGSQAGVQFYRYLLYAPLFCAPILLMSLPKVKAWKRRGLAILTITPLFFLSLPTFLSSVNTVATDAIYPYECTVGEFMESHSSAFGENLILYRTSGLSTAWYSFYTPDAAIRGVPETAVYSVQELWLEVETISLGFRSSPVAPDRQKIFVLSEKSTVAYEHTLGIPPNDPGWAKLLAELDTTDKVYDNGHVRLFVPRV